MRYRGKLSVLSALANGESVLIVVLGGGMSCVVSLGVLVALVRANLHSRLRAGIGVSGGACNLAAVFSNPEKIESVMEMYRHMACGGFLSIRWGPLGPHLWFDSEELMHALEGRRSHLGLPALDEKKIMLRPHPFWVAATDHTKGTCVFLNARRRLFRSLRATMAIPGVCEPVIVGGRKLSDGAVGMKIETAVRGARRVLVVMNRPPPENRVWWEQMFTPMVTRFALRSESSKLREAAAWMDTDFEEDLRRLEACTHVDTLVVHPTDPNLFPFCSFWPQLKTAYEDARDFTERLIDEAHAV